MVKVFLLSWLMPSPCHRHASPLWSLRHGFISSWQRCQRHTPIIEPSDGREESASNNNTTKCPINYPTRTTDNNVVTHQPTESASFRFVKMLKLNFISFHQFLFPFIISSLCYCTAQRTAERRFTMFKCIWMEKNVRIRSFGFLVAGRWIDVVCRHEWPGRVLIEKTHSTKNIYAASDDDDTLQLQVWQLNEKRRRMARRRGPEAEREREKNRCKLYWNFFRRSETKRNIK